MAVVKMLANKCDDGNDAIGGGSLYVIRIGRDLHVMIVWDPLDSLCFFIESTENSHFSKKMCMIDVRPCVSLSSS